MLRARNVLSKTKHKEAHLRWAHLHLMRKPAPIIEKPAVPMRKPAPMRKRIALLGVFALIILVAPRLIVSLLVLPAARASFSAAPSSSSAAPLPVHSLASTASTPLTQVDASARPSRR